MPKKKERSPDEFWKGRCRELEKENRQLKRLVKELEKTKHIYEDYKIYNPDDNIEEKPKKIICTACGKGTCKEINILDRIFLVCQTCGERKKISGGTSGGK